MRDRKRRCTSRTLIEPLELDNCMRIVCCTVETTPKTHAARRAWWDALQRLETPACGIRSAAAPFAPNSARWNSTHACWAPSSGTRLTHCYHTMKQRDNHDLLHHSICALFEYVTQLIGSTIHQYPASNCLTKLANRKSTWGWGKKTPTGGSARWAREKS